jgi:hypothetical protein
MAVNNTNGAFSIGRDCTLVLTSGALGGGRIQLDNVTGFDAKQTTTSVSVNRLDSTTLHGEIPRSWNGSFELERGSSVLDDEFAAKEQAFYANGGVAMYQLFQYVQEPNGSRSVFQFIDVALKYEEAGQWKADATVKQRVSFNASRRQRV